MQLQKERVLGFDTETRPFFAKVNPTPALLQLAGANEVVLFQVQQCGITPALNICYPPLRW